MQIKSLLLSALVALAAPAALAHDTGHGGHAEVKAGDLTIASPFTRATPPAAPVAGGFFTVTNAGAADDTLIGALSDIAGRMEVHEMSMDNGVMKMRELAAGLPIPAGQTVELKPGGYHIMFMDLKGPLVEGETVGVTLVFEKAGEVTVQMPVQARGAMGHTGH